MNMITYGRTTTLTLQTMKHTDEGFTGWYAPWQAKFAEDPLMAYFNQSRTAIIHEGHLHVSTVTSIGARGGLDPIKMLEEMNQYAPPGTEEAFIDNQCRSGWRVRMPDGSLQSVYFAMPEGVDITTEFEFRDAPDVHFGQPIPDPSVTTVGGLYLDTLGTVVSEFIARFSQAA